MLASALHRLRTQGLIEQTMGKKRLVVASASARSLFRQKLVRSLRSTPDHDRNIPEDISLIAYGSEAAFSDFSILR